MTQLAETETYTDRAKNRYHKHPLYNAVWVADAEQRMNFLPTYFTHQYLAFERAVFHMAEGTIEDSHGYWEYALTADGIPFVYPAYKVIGDDLSIRMSVSNAFGDNTQELHPVLAGIHTTMLAVLAMMHAVDKLQLSDEEESLLHDRYHQLKDLGFKLAKGSGEDQYRAFYVLIN